MNKILKAAKGQGNMCGSWGLKAPREARATEHSGRVVDVNVLEISRERGTMKQGQEGSERGE